MGCEAQLRSDKSDETGFDDGESLTDDELEE